VQHVHNTLAPCKEPVCHELASPDGAGLVSHVCCLAASDASWCQHRSKTTP
jgi:hypothetical protein